MSRELIREYVWTSLVTCARCRDEERFWHHGRQTRSQAKADWPSHLMNGWDVSRPGRERCPLCVETERLLRGARSKED